MARPRTAAASAEPALRPPPGNPKLAMLDGLRGLGALCVLVVHVGSVTAAGLGTRGGNLFSRLEIAMPVFFTLSGFLIYRPFVAAAWRQAPPATWTAYMGRRLLRLAPAFVVAFTLVYSLPFLRDPLPTMEGVRAGDVVAQLLLVHIYDARQVSLGLAPSWSLGVELSWYALIPLYAWLVGRMAPARRRVVVELTVLALLGLASAAVRARHANVEPWPHTLPGTFTWFVPGMALAVVSVAGASDPLVGRLVAAVRRRPAACWLPALVLFAAVWWWGGTPRTVSVDHPERRVLAEYLSYTVIVLLLVAPAALDAGGLGQRVLTWRPLVWLGVVSYGVYLWHFPLVFVVRDALPGLGPVALFGLTLALSLAVAAASYFAIERPLLLLRHRAALPAARLRTGSTGTGSPG